jgi:hypothetical protein
MHRIGTHKTKQPDEMCDGKPNKKVTTSTTASLNSFCRRNKKLPKLGYCRK